MPIIQMTTYKISTPGPTPTTLTYDFTQSDGGWTDTGGFSRDSSGFYRSGTYSDGYIIAPSEIFDHTPKKITINYNKTGASAGTGYLSIQNNNWISGSFLPEVFNRLNNFQIFLEGISSNIIDLGANPTGDINWIMDIDSSTTNWTVTHKIGNLQDVIDNYGALKYAWDVQDFRLRIVNWYSSQGLFIKSITFEY